MNRKEKVTISSHRYKLVYSKKDLCRINETT